MDATIADSTCAIPHPRELDSSSTCIYSAFVTPRKKHLYSRALRAASVDRVAHYS